MIYRFLYLDVFCIDNNFLYDLLDFDDFRNLFCDGNQNLLLSRNFDNFFFDSWNFYKLFHNAIDYLDNFDWLVYYLLDLDVLGNLNYFLDVFLDRYDFWYFY